VWLAVAGRDAEAAARILYQDWHDGASAEERAAAAAIVNHDADEVTCPACGHGSPAGTRECGDCGLSLL